MDETIWKIYDEDDNPEYEQICNNILENPHNILSPNIFSEKFIRETYQNFEKRIIKKNTILELEIFLSIFEEDAINIIKNIFNFNYNIPDGYNLKKLIGAPPLYKIKLDGPKKSVGMEILQNISKIITNSVNKLTPGNFKLNISPIKIIETESFKIKFLNK